MQGSRSYYRWKTGEVIDFVAYLPFIAGNVFKYILRPGKQQYREDLEKAKWYLRWWLNDGCPDITSVSDNFMAAPFINGMSGELWAKGLDKEREAFLAAANAFFWSTDSKERAKAAKDAVEALNVCIKELKEEEEKNGFGGRS